MKPFSAIDITMDKDNEVQNGEQFIVEKPSEANVNALETSTEKAAQAISKSLPSKPFIIACVICGIVGIVIPSGVLRSLLRSGESFTDIYNTIPWLFWIAGVFVIALFVLIFLQHKKQKSVLDTEENQLLNANIDSICDNIFGELSVPKDAQEVDVLFFYYKTLGEEIKVCKQDHQSAPYDCFAYKAFVDSENLYLASLDGKYAFPLSSLSGIRTIDKTVCIEDWNKDTPHNKEPYKQYKIKTDDNQCYRFKTYHILELNQKGEAWGIYFPCYELPAFESLTGLKGE